MKPQTDEAISRTSAEVCLERGGATRAVRHIEGEVVYFVHCEAAGLMKIGKSMDFRQRLESLRAMSGVPVRAVHMLRGYTNEEKSLHAHFADRRAHGEWFHVAPEEAATMTSARLWAITKAWLASEPVRQAHERREGEVRRRAQRIADGKLRIGPSL